MLRALLLPTFVFGLVACTDDDPAADGGVALPDAAVFPDASEPDAALPDALPDAETFPDAVVPDAEPKMITFDDESAKLGGEDTLTSDVLVADMDNDADSDIVFINWWSGPMGEIPGGIVVSKNLGARVFENIDVVPTSTLNPSWIEGAVGDLDGDSDLDLVVSRPSGGSWTQIGVFLNDGLGTLTASAAAVPEIDADVYGVHYAGPSLGDFDLDGDLDIFFPMYVDVANTTDVPNLLLLNDGRGKFTLDETGRLPEIVDHGNYTAAVAVGDVDGDLDLDIFLGTLYLRSRLLINDGGGRFVEESMRLMSLSLQPLGAEMIDLDGDADLDIVTSNVELQDRPIGTRIYVNDGTGNFVSETLREERDHATGDFVHVDLDGDGFKDWVLSNVYAPMDGNGIQILFGRAEGEPEAALLEPMVGAAENIEAADFDGDGRVDLVIGTYDLPNVLLFGRGS